MSQSYEKTKCFVAISLPLSHIVMNIHTYPCHVNIFLKEHIMTSYLQLSYFAQNTLINGVSLQLTHTAPHT